MNKIFAVVVLDYSDGQYQSSRTMGFFTSLEHFEQSLEKYSDWICEGIGKYLVIEPVEVNEYIFSYEDNLIWYEYNVEKKLYEKCECPEEHKSTVGFWQ